MRQNVVLCGNGLKEHWAFHIVSNCRQNIRKCCENCWKSIKCWFSFVSTNQMFDLEFRINKNKSGLSNSDFENMDLVCYRRTDLDITRELDSVRKAAVRHVK